MKRYNEYKDSGVQWLGEIPSHWEVVKMKYITYPLKSGGTPQSGREDFYSDEGTPWVSIGDMSSVDTLTSTKKCVTQKGIDNKKLEIFPKGTLLYSIYATLGKVCELSVPATINQAILAINIKIEDYFQPYLKYFLRAIEPNLQCLSNSNTQYNLNADIVKNIKVLQCPLHEQQAIATYLDTATAKIDEAIAQQQKMIDLLNERKQIIINNAVTKGLNPNVPMKDSGVDWIGEIPEHWEIMKLKSIGTTINGVSHDSSYFGEGYPFVSYSDVYKNITLPSAVNGLAKSSEAEQRYFSVEEGDVFFTRTSETVEDIGCTSVCLETIPKAVFAGFLIRFRPTKNILDKHFAKYFFRANCHRDYFVKEMNLVTRASLSQQLLKGLPVLLPSLEEQAKIALYLDKNCNKIDSAISNATKQIALLQERKQIIINDVVTGKVKVTN